jgi:hypothetical protein
MQYMAPGVLLQQLSNGLRMIDDGRQDTSLRLPFLQQLFGGRQQVFSKILHGLLFGTFKQSGFLAGVAKIDTKRGGKRSSHLPNDLSAKPI